MVKGKIGVTTFTSIILSLMCWLGYYTKRHFDGMGTLSSIGLFLLMAFVCWAVAFGVFALLDKVTVKPINDTCGAVDRIFGRNSLSFLIIFILLLVAWIPAFLAFYPGLFVYDAQWQYFMYINGEVTTHHPIIHTYLLGWVVDVVHSLTGSINKGIAAYTVLQMLIMGLGCAYVLDYFVKKKYPRWLLILSFVFFAAFPTLVIFVFSCTKDSFFGIAVADFLLLNLGLFNDSKVFFEKKRNIVLWIVFALEVCILRNNAIYAVICVLPFFVVFLTRAKCNKVKAFGMLAATIALFFIYKYPVTNAVTVEGTSKAEMLSVPCQQIMRVYKYHYDELNDSLKEKVETLFDSEKWYGYYVPEIADATKGSLRMDVYDEDSALFWGLWKDMLKEYPGEYIGSFLENTYGFWYPWPHYIIYSFGDEGYTPITAMAPAEPNSKLSGLLNYYKNFENGSIVQGMPAVSWLFAPATYFYFMLIIAVYILKEKKFNLSISFLFIFLLWCTYLLGPVAMVRYALYLFYLVPVWVAYIIEIKKNN